MQQIPGYKQDWIRICYLECISIHGIPLFSKSKGTKIRNNESNMQEDKMARENEHVAQHPLIRV